jgi:hypothetical protein
LQRSDSPGHAEPLLVSKSLSTLLDVRAKQ